MFPDDDRPPTWALVIVSGSVCLVLAALIWLVAILAVVVAS